MSVSTPDRKLLLYADDNADDRLLVKEALAESYPHVTLASVDDGQDLLDYLRGVTRQGTDFPRPLPDAILLDWRMPKMDGWQALSALKQDADFKHIPVVILTTSDDPVQRELALELGAEDFLRKPRSREDLVQVLAAVNRVWDEASEALAI